MPHSTIPSPSSSDDDLVAQYETAAQPARPSDIGAAGVAEAALTLVTDESLWPQNRLIGAQALLDDLARALARMALDLQPERSPDSSEPDR